MMPLGGDDVERAGGRIDPVTGSFGRSVGRLLRVGLTVDVLHDPERLRRLARADPERFGVIELRVEVADEDLVGDTPVGATAGRCRTLGDDLDAAVG